MMKSKRVIVWLAIIVGLIALSAVVTKFVHGQDFLVYYVSAQSLLAGRTDLYASDFGLDPMLDYRYPPIFILLFAPFGLLHLTAAKFVWSFLTLGSVLVAVSLYGSTFKSTLISSRYNKLIFAVAGLLTLKYVLMTVKSLNVHLIILSIFVIALCQWIRRRTEVASALTGLAISVKVFPILSLPYFLIRRQWRFVLMTLGCILVFVLLPSLYFGFGTNAQLHAEWARHVVSAPEFYELNGPHDMAVDGIITRYFSHIDYQSRMADREYPNVNVANIDRNILKVVGLALAALIGVITYLVIIKRNWRRKSASTDDNAIYEFGLVICMILLVGPRTNAPYAAALFVPLTALLYSLIVKHVKLLILPLAVVAMVSVYLPLIPGARMARLFNALGVEFFSFFAAWLGLIWVLLRDSFTVRNAPDFPSAVVSDK